MAHRLKRKERVFGVAVIPAALLEETADSSSRVFLDALLSAEKESNRRRIETLRHGIFGDGSTG